MKRMTAVACSEGFAFVCGFSFLLIVIFDSYVRNFEIANFGVNINTIYTEFT